MARLVRFCLTTSLLIGGLASGCQCDHRVPFESAPAHKALARAAEGREQPPTPFEATQGTTFPELTKRVAVEGAPIEVAVGSIRALLPLDIDGDGDRDALLLTTNENGAPILALAKRDGSAFGALGNAVGGYASACTLKNASMRLVSERYAVASLERVCEGAQGTVASVWIVAVGEPVRVAERVAILPANGRAEGKIQLDVRTEDHDHDGHEDVLLTASIQPRDSNAIAHVVLPWVDRVSGLARDTREPESTVRSLAAEAKDTLRSNVDGAIEKARQALLVHDAFCRESNVARVQFGDSEGLACGASEGAGSAAVSLTRALARKGDVWGATQALARLTKPGYAAPQSARQEAERSVAGLPPTQGVTWREVARMDTPRAPSIRLSALAFADERTLILRGTPPRRIDIDAARSPTEGLPPQEAQDHAGDADVLMRDPSGRFAVVAIERTCEGDTLVIVPAASVVAGIVAARAHARPILAERFAERPCAAPPAGAGSPLDFAVLGWAPQGIVAAHGSEVRVVPLTSEAQIAGQPSILSMDTPLPAPLTAGAATVDGRAYAIATRFGVFLKTYGNTPRSVFLRPPGWDSAEGTATDAAVSPDTRRVAVLRGTHVWLIERAPSPD